MKNWIQSYLANRRSLQREEEGGGPAWDSTLDFGMSLNAHYFEEMNRNRNDRKDRNVLFYL